MPTDKLLKKRLIQQEQGFSEERVGTPLATCIPEGVDLASWPVTFEDEFTDVNTRITDNDGAGPWFAPGPYRSIGLGTIASATDPADPIYTQEPDGLGLGTRSGREAEWSVETNLQVGDERYTDRDYLFNYAPAEVVGAEWIKTANDSKAYTGSPTATFTVTAAAVVYVVHRDTISPKPSWMSTWTDTGLKVNTGFTLFSKQFTAGVTVELGPNGNTVQSMYTVIVVPEQAGDTGLITDLVVLDTAGHWEANIATGTFGPVDLLHEPNIGFAQQYGYFECRIKPADPAGANAVLWPAFWLNSLSGLGGSTGNLGWNRIEFDCVELYTGPGGPLGNDQGGHHFSIHHHEPEKWTAPGVWGRDIHASLYTGLEDNPIWETNPNFQFWHDYHTYGLLMTPDWVIAFFDRLEVARFPMIEEFQQKFYLLVSCVIHSIGSGGMPAGQQYSMLVDYVRVWQNPNWNTTSGPMLDRGALTGGASPDAKTFQTGTPMSSYAAGDGRSFVVSTATANTGPATANANGLGALPIYQVVQNDGNSTQVPLSGGEILANSWFGLSLDMSYAGGNGGWRLLAPGFSMKMPEPYVPPVLTKPHHTINVEALEAGLAEKHGIPGSLFPQGHPARTPKVVEPDVPPRMPTSAKHVIDTISAGEVIGTATVSNTPTRDVRYALTNADGTESPYFDVDPATGEYSVRAGTTMPSGSYEFAVSAWPTPPQAIVPGSNSTRINVDVRFVHPLTLDAKHVLDDDGVETLAVTATNTAGGDTAVGELAWTIGGTSGTDPLPSPLASGASHTVHIPLGSLPTPGTHARQLRLTAPDLPDVVSTGTVVMVTAAALHGAPNHAITVDGTLDDLTGVPGIDLATDGVVKNDTDTPPDYGGVGDLSGQLWVTWDDDSFYLSARIHDDVFAQPNTGADIWRGDSIQFGFAAGMPGESDATFQYTIAQTPNGPHAHRWHFPGGESEPVTGVQLNVTRNESATNTIYELAIPWNGLMPAPFDPGDRLFSLSLLVNDDDGQGREHWIEWGSGIGAVKDPGLYKPVRLDPATSAVCGVTGEPADGRATVMIGDEDSGVSNYDAGNGCTVNDLIDDGRHWPNQGDLVRHVGDVTEGLVDTGVLTARERGAIIRAAAQSR